MAAARALLTRQQPDRLEGDGLALAGLILGYLSLLIGILVVMFLVLGFGLLVVFA